MLERLGRRKCHIILISCFLWITVWAVILAYVPFSWFVHISSSFSTYQEGARSANPVRSFPLPSPSPIPAPSPPSRLDFAGNNSDNNPVVACQGKEECDKRLFELVTVKEPPPRLTSFCTPSQPPADIQCATYKRTNIQKVLQVSSKEMKDNYHYCLHYYGDIEIPAQTTRGAVTVVEDGILKAPLMLNNTMYLYQDSYKVLSTVETPPS